jgi:hypothetical protein
MQPVLIVWEDSRVPRDSWEWITKDTIPKCTRCQSVGFIVAETDSALLLSPTIGYEEDGDKQMIGAITIARRQVVEITCLSSSACLVPGLNQMRQPFSRFLACLCSVKAFQLPKRLLCLFSRFLPLVKAPMVEDINFIQPNEKINRAEGSGAMPS